MESKISLLSYITKDGHIDDFPEDVLFKLNNYICNLLTTTKHPFKRNVVIMDYMMWLKNSRQNIKNCITLVYSPQHKVFCRPAGVFVYTDLNDALKDINQLVNSIEKVWFIGGFEMFMVSPFVQK